jgi:hypothetical protein
MPEPRLTEHQRPAVDQQNRHGDRRHRRREHDQPADRPRHVEGALAAT